MQATYCLQGHGLRGHRLRLLVRALRIESAGIVMLLTAVAMFASARTASAQSLNWEGQMGVFVTPLAYAVPSPEKNIGLPVVAYHYLNGGKVLGEFHQASVTVGLFDRVDFGYTRTLHETGTTAGLSPLWSRGFNTFHGKVNFLRENRTWRPALAVGFVARSQVRNVGGVIQGQDTHNEDFYIVATKTLTQIRQLPLVFNFGFKDTNASLLGLAGNAPAHQGRLFGAAAFALRGPRRSTILLGSEILQEPRRIQGLPGVVVPSTVTYAVRILPGGALPLRGWNVESPKITIDLGVAQAVGTIAPGLDLQARYQFAMGISYGF